MALTAELNIEGLIADAAYWRIGELYWNSNDPGTLNFRLDGYASTEAYQQNKGAIVSKMIQIEMPLDQPEDPRTALFNQVRTQAYGLIKAVPGFEDSIDS